MTNKKQYTIKEQVLKDLKINKSVPYITQLMIRIEREETPSAIKRTMGTDFKTTEKIRNLIPQIKEGWSKAPEEIDAEEYSQAERYRQRKIWDMPTKIEDMGRPWGDIKDFVDFKIEDMNRYDDLQELEKLVPEHFWSRKHLEDIGMDQNESLSFLSEYHQLNVRKLKNSGTVYEHSYTKKFRGYDRFIYILFEVFFRTMDNEIPYPYFTLAMDYALQSIRTGDRTLFIQAKLMIAYRIWKDNNLGFQQSLRRYLSDSKVTGNAIQKLENTIKEIENLQIEMKKLRKKKDGAE